jgi:hypothetical protein
LLSLRLIQRVHQHIVLQNIDLGSRDLVQDHVFEIGLLFVVLCSGFDRRLLLLHQLRLLVLDDLVADLIEQPGLRHHHVQDVDEHTDLWREVRLADLGRDEELEVF